jgi:hypothetical protein
VNCVERRGRRVDELEEVGRGFWGSWVEHHILVVERRVQPARCPYGIRSRLFLALPRESISPRKTFAEALELRFRIRASIMVQSYLRHGPTQVRG